MTAAPFDTLKLARALRDRGGMTGDHAEATADALAEAMGGAELATRTDLRHELQLLEQRLIIKTGAMIAAAVAATATLVKLL